LGRAEVGHVVDAVFVTLDRRDTRSTNTSNHGLSSTLTKYRYTYLKLVSPAADTSQCCRLSNAQHIHVAEHTHRWTTPNRRDNIRSWLQAICAYQARDRGFASRGNRSCSLSDGFSQETALRGRHENSDRAG
jgi:hypothetical protein